MAISDINKAMAMYAQPTEFDQNAWKTAFDIANGFTTAEYNRTKANDAARAYQENMATSQNRIDFMNWEFDNKRKVGDITAMDLQRTYNNALKTDPSAIQATIAQNNFATNSANISNETLLGSHEAQQKYAKYAFDQNGNPRKFTEVHQAMLADGVKLDNPYAVVPYSNAGLQERANQQAIEQALINNSMGMTYDALGNPVPTGKIDPALFETKANQLIATGRMTPQRTEELRKVLFPQATPSAVQTPSILPTGSTFTQMYNNLPKPAIAPYAVGAAPVSATTQAMAVPSEQAIAPFTPEQQRQVLLNNLNNWQNGGHIQSWQDYFSNAEKERIAKANAIKSVMEQTKINYPF